MSKPVRREEILDFVTYGEERDRIRADAMAQKDARRVFAGKYLTFLFENHDTIRYQVLEMVRAERIVKEADILHELETYNELLGGPGEIGCTLLIEIADPQERQRRLVEWRTLPDRIFLVLSDGRRVKAAFDQRQMDESRLSSVQFLRFDTGGQVPSAILVDHPELREETALTEAQRSALGADLAS